MIKGYVETMISSIKHVDSSNSAHQCQCRNFFLGFQAKRSPKSSCLIFTKNHCSLLQTFLCYCMKLWQHKGLKLTIDFFSKKIFQCGFLAKKTENQVDVLNLIYIYIYIYIYTYICLMRGKGEGRSFGFLLTDIFTPFFS